MPKNKRILRCPGCNRPLKLVGDFTWEGKQGSILSCGGCFEYSQMYNATPPDALAMGNLFEEQKEKVRKGFHPFHKSTLLENPNL
jgi:hypothetical protein